MTCEKTDGFRVCPIMTKPTGDLQYPYSCVVYCDCGYVTIGNDGSQQYVNPRSPDVKCRAWSETRGCVLCKYNG
jgi:hypothetical protein